MSDLHDIAGGDERRARELHDALLRLADGKNPLLREMSEAVINGELALRDAVASDTYASQFAEPFKAFWSQYQELTEADRDQLPEPNSPGTDAVESPRPTPGLLDGASLDRWFDGPTEYPL
ncbi:hypothetical protein ACIBTV_17305 [Micromonospora sp. NPDC049366]|uniref:hypothetical protein n=1 Tax=Micromonospora sp. NPDC049366 TaxID=3364271 RepID=UPI003795E518